MGPVKLQFFRVSVAMGAGWDVLGGPPEALMLEDWLRVGMGKEQDVS